MLGSLDPVSGSLDPVSGSLDPVSGSIPGATNICSILFLSSVFVNLIFNERVLR